MTEVMLPKSLVLYGAGGFGERVYQLLSGLGHEVVRVVDQNAKTTSWCQAVPLDPSAVSSETVVTAIFSPQPNIAEIAQVLHSFGCLDVITPPSLFRYLSMRGVDENLYWLTTEPVVENSAESINKTRGLLRDAESQQIFESLLQYRRTGLVEFSPAPRPLVEQHTGSDFGFLDGLRGDVVDCGAYTGDTLLNWAEVMPAGSRVLALEPDLSNFEVLLATLGTVDLDVLPVPVGVGDCAGRQSVVGKGPSAYLAPDDDGPVMNVMIDQLMARSRTGLIKMDIEGGEAAALRGALGVLRRDRPLLSISVYHKPWHLWSIANWLEDNVGGYEFRLRTYGNQGYDTILYGSPTSVG